MKKILLMVLLALATVSMVGCVVAVGNGSDCPKGKNTHAKSTTMVEIDAVGKLIGPSSQARGYKAIAERQNLTEAERVYLIKAIERNIISPTDKENLLVLLIKNRQFPETADAKIQPSAEQQ